MGSKQPQPAPEGTRGQSQPKSPPPPPKVGFARPSTKLCGYRNSSRDSEVRLLKLRVKELEAAIRLLETGVEPVPQDGLPQFKGDYIDITGKEDHTTGPTEWHCASMHCPAGRRGIWYRVQDGILYVRGGREGDDAEARIDSKLIPAIEYNELVSALNCGSWMQEDNGPDTKLVPTSKRADTRLD